MPVKPVVRFRLALGAAVLSVVSLFFFDFPHSYRETFFPGHSTPVISSGSSAATSAHQGPETLNRLSSLIRFPPLTPAWKEIGGWLLVVVCPVGAALAAYWVPRQHPRRGLWQIAAALTLFPYLYYFRWTYHAGLLLLGLLAWLLAALHAHDLLAITTDFDTGNRKLEELTSRQKADFAVSNRQLEELTAKQKAIHESFAHTSLSDFYRQFYDAMKSAKEVLSVERFWTMEASPWNHLSITDLTREGVRFSLAVRQLCRHSRLYRSIRQSAATRILFIGPMPSRNDQNRYEGDDLGQLICLVYTMCVLEIARIRSLTIGDKGPDIRYQCAIGDVPSWAKVVDDKYWLLQGRSRESIRVLDFRSDTEPALGLHGDSDSAAALYAHQRAHRLHIARTTAHRNLIALYDRNARRAYEHICTLLLEFATRQLGVDLQPQTRLSSHFHRLIEAIAGGRQGLEFFCKNHARPGTEPHHVVFLFQLFLALHFFNGTKLYGSALEEAYAEVTLSALWERCA